MRHFIHEHLEHISVKMFDENQADLKEILKGKLGVYALYRGGKLKYVGRASNLFQRIKRHRHDRHAQMWDSFSAYVTADNTLAHEVESLALRIAMPPSNRTSGRFCRSKNLYPDLRDAYRHRQKQEEIELLGLRPRSNRLKKARSRASKGAKSPSDLVGLVSRKRALCGWYKGKEYRATLFPNGEIQVGKTRYPSPQQSILAAINRRKSGWSFWHFKNSEGEWCPLRDLK